MKHLVLIIFLLLVPSIFGQVKTIDRSDTSFQVVHNYWLYDHWMVYPATSAVYVPPCVYRIVPPDSSNIENTMLYPNEHFQLVKQYDKYGIINKGDTVIIPLEYDSLISISDSWSRVFIAKKKDRFGLINAENEIVIPFDYDRIHLMTNGHYLGLWNGTLLVEKDEKTGLMRLDGSVELSCSYEDIDIRCEQTDCPKTGVQYYVKQNGKYGYINRDESVAIPLKYEALDAHGFEGLIKAKSNGKVGLMDTLEHFVLPQEYEELYSEYFWSLENLTAFKKDGKWGLMHGEYSDMQVVLENRFDSVMTQYDFAHHFIIINQGKWGLADTNGNVVIEPQFQQIDAMEDGTFAYKKDNKWGFMNDKGFVHCSPRYDSIYDNQKDWCLVTKGDGFGFCKTSGRQIVPPIYNAPYWDDYLRWEQMLYNGHIALAKGDYYEDCKMGVIDSSGRTVLPFEYDCRDELIYNFGTCLIATKNDKEVLINGKGKPVNLGDYDRIEQRRYGYDYFFPINGDKVGLVSPEGKVISRPKYDEIEILWWSPEWSESSTVFFMVEQDEKVGLLDSNGRTLLAPVYEELQVSSESLIQLFSGSRVQLYNLKTKEYESFSATDSYHFNGEVGAFSGANGKSFFIDEKGNRIDNNDYSEIWSLGSDGQYFEVKKKGRYGICDVNGKGLFEPKFSKIKYWDGTFGAGKSGDKYCFFDANGDTIVGYCYEKVKGVYNDLVCVRIGNKFGVVTKAGEEVVAPTLQVKLNFEELKEIGLTIVQEHYKFGVINREMKAVLPAKYDAIKLIKAYEKKYILAYLNKEIEVYDSEGNLISENMFLKWEQNETGVLYLFNWLGKYRLNEQGKIELMEE